VPWPKFELITKRVSERGAVLQWDIVLQRSEETFFLIAERDATRRMQLLDPLFRWQALDETFSDRAGVQRMLEFEAALARAEARTGVIPAAAAVAIEKKCRAEHINFQQLAHAAALAGNLAIPLVKQLIALVAEDGVESARFVHWGATSQDVIDTAFVLQLREALGLIFADLDRLSLITAELTAQFRAAPLAGRTWMQQALPTTFGFKTAGWLDALTRHQNRFSELQRRIQVLQFGGAVGTLAALDGKGLDVARAVADELHLDLPDIPWQSHRDRIAEVATTMGLLSGTLGKIARDISLHSQTEVAELSEPSVEGRGGSSTMPHKRNPVTSAVVLSAAIRVPALVSTILSAMVQEDERGLGGWHAEWESLPEIIMLVGGALHHLTEALPGLTIHSEKMRENLELTKGLIFAEAVTMALGSKIGRPQAHQLVEAACQRATTAQKDLRAILAQDPAIAGQLSSADLDRLFDPQRYLGVSNLLIERVLTSHQNKKFKNSGESE
jgi:3-carboxy-cis,cis-muconate cycloisomerase